MDLIIEAEMPLNYFGGGASGGAHGLAPPHDADFGGSHDASWVVGQRWGKRSYTTQVGGLLEK